MYIARKLNKQQLISVSTKGVHSKMQILDQLEINNYRNLKKVKLNNLKSLNIFIGPNNCGKTTILKIIELLKESSIMSPENNKPSYECKNCEFYAKNLSLIIKDFLIVKLKYNSKKEQAFLRRLNFGINYKFNESYLVNQFKKFYPAMKISTLLDFKNILSSTFEKHYPPVSAPEYKKVAEHIKSLQPDTIVLKQVQEDNSILNHVSILSLEHIATHVQKSILLIDDSRLQSYKNMDIVSYIRNKNLSGKQMTSLISFLHDIIDPKLSDYKQSTLDLVKNNDLVTSISEQGSGVKSLVCLAADILSSEEESMLLIDEPELGLNPAAKKEFLAFLVEQSKTKQIFVATHDPNFLNPLIVTDDTAIYIYSPVYDGKDSEPEEPNFVKVDLKQSKEEPTIFSGYLPHTESLKPLHIYVEGSKDVFAVQRFLIEYLKNKFKKDWIDKFNQVSVQHLGGTFWKHLLYTLLGKPYMSIVILDNDKMKEAGDVCEVYSSIEISHPPVVFCTNTDEVKNKISLARDNQICPVYCLTTQDGCVEELETKKDVEKEIKTLLDIIIV